MSLRFLRRCGGYSFFAACLLSVCSPAQDVSLYEVARGEYFTQATSNRADTAHALLHELYAYVQPAYDGSVLSATLTSPKAQKYSLTNYNSEFELLSPSGTAVRFSNAAPSGEYQFHVQCANEGLKTERLSLPGPATGIPPARVANYSGLQAVDASQDMEVRWDKITRRGAHDFLQFDIVDTEGNAVFSQSQIGLEATNYTIPAGTLQPNSTNTGFLVIVHYDAISPGSKTPHWLSAERRMTRFHITTLNPAGVFRISPLCVTANENAGFATMTVQRMQGSAGEVAVDYFSADGTARSNVNYMPVSGTLVFADGVTNQTFTVPLLNDGVTNSPLTVHFTLTNATGGAALEIRPHAILTILDSQSAPGPNVNACLLSKVEFYDQTNADKPLQSARSTTSRFFVAVHPKFPGGIMQGALKLPNGSTCALGCSLEDYQAFFEYVEDFPSPTSMTSRFRSGKYEINFEAFSQGSNAVHLTLGAERVFSVPHLTNWTEAQAIEPGQPFVLNWEPFVGATTNDCVLVTVKDNAGEYVVRTPDEFEPGVLPGTTRSLTIPANLLEYGNRYVVNIIFVKMVAPARDVRTGIRTAVEFMHTTILDINTVPQPQ